MNYILPNQAGTKDLLQGYGAGLGFQGARQQMAMNAAREARAAELHPLAVSGAEQGLAMNAAREARAAELHPLAVAGAQQGLDQSAAAAARAAELHPYAVMGADQRVVAAESAQHQADKAAQRKTAFHAAMRGLAQKGGAATVEDYQAVMAEFPEMSGAIAETWDVLDDNRKKGTAGVLGKAAVLLRNGNVDKAIELAEQYAEAAENSGDAAGAAAARSMVEIAKMDPDAALATLGVTLAQLDPNVAGEVFGSAAKVRQSEILPDGSTISVSTDGAVTVKDPAGNVVTGQDAADVVARARAAGVTEQGERARARATGTDLADVTTGGAAEAEKAAGTVVGKDRGESMVSARTDIGKARRGIDLINSIINDENLPNILGRFQGNLPAAAFGDQGRDLLARVEQLQGQVFMAAYQDLRGGGQITEVEGAKAEAALANLNRLQSPEQYRENLRVLRGVMEAAMDRAQKVLDEPAPTPTGAVRPYLDP